MPTAVVHALFSSLAGKYPLVSSPLEDISLDVYCAQTIYNLWIIHCLSLPTAPPLLRGYEWEGTSATPETIINMVFKKIHQ